MSTIYKELKVKSELYWNCFTQQEEKLKYSLECFLFDPEKCFLLLKVGNPCHVVRSITKCVEGFSGIFKDHYEDLMCFTWKQCCDVITSTETIYKLPSLMILDYDKVEFSPMDEEVLTRLCDHVTMCFNTKSIILISFQMDGMLNLFQQHLDPDYYTAEDFSSRNLDMIYEELMEKPISLIDAATLGKLNDVMHFIANGAEPNVRNAPFNTALIEAAKRGHQPVVLFLLKHGAKHIVNIAGQTPLHVAAAEGHIETVKTLLLHDANVNATDGFKLTPLHLACTYGHKDVVIILIECGADLEADTEKCRTSLYVATCQNHVEVIKVLLKYGAKVDSLPPDSLTPLHAAADNGYLEAVKLLIEHGVNPDTKHNGQTAMEMAQTKGFTDIVEYLKTDE